MFDLIKDADSVELKLTVPEADHRSTAVALGMDPTNSDDARAYVQQLAVSKAQLGLH